MKRFSGLNFILIAMLLFISIFSATAWSASDDTLTLSEATRLALKSDYSIVAAQYEAEKARLAVKAEALKLFPQANVTTTFGYNVEEQNFPINIVISISETIPSKYHAYGSVVATALEAALWDQLNAECALQITRADVIYNTTVYYLNVLKYQKTLTIQETALQKAQEANTLALAELQLGQITKPTQLQAENDLAMAEFNLEQSRQNLLLARRQLENEIGRPDLSQVKLAEPEELVPPVQPDYVKLKAELIQHRLETQAEQISVRKAERELAQAKNDALPALNLSLLRSNETYNIQAGYNFLTGDISWNASLRKNISEFFSDIDTRDTFRDRTGITVKWVYKFDWGVTRIAVAQSELSLKSALSNQAKMKQNLLYEMDQAVSAYQLAVMQTAVKQRAIAYYQKTREIKALEFELGSATKLDLFAAEIDLDQAQSDAVSYSYDQMAAYQKLLLTAGRLYPFKPESK